MLHKEEWSERLYIHLIMAASHPVAGSGICQLVHSAAMSSNSSLLELNSGSILTSSQSGRVRKVICWYDSGRAMLLLSEDTLDRPNKTWVCWRPAAQH